MNAEYTDLTSSDFASSTLRVSGSQLHGGNIPVAGYKHAAVQLMAAAVIVNYPVEISNVPLIEDTRVLAEIIRWCGGQATQTGHRLSVDARSMSSADIPEALSAPVHGSLYLIPSFLARLGEVEFGGSGGCQIGSSIMNGRRPVSHMISVMERFGARFDQTDGRLRGYCPGFHATTLDILDYSDDDYAVNGPLVSGATKTAILCALGCKDGESHILHPYRKSDVLELLRFARKCGFAVEMDAEGIRVAREREAKATTHDLMSCLSEIITYVSLAIHTGTPLQLTRVTPERAKEGLRPELEVLARMGVRLEWGQDSVLVAPPVTIYPTNIEVTSSGIFSDHQPFFALMLAHAAGVSRIHERVWTERFHYVHGLSQLGARIARQGSEIKVYPSDISCPGQTVTANDLRAAAVLLLASLTVPGVTTIRNAYHLQRGYENLVATLKVLGARIDEVTED